MIAKEVKKMREIFHRNNPERQHNYSGDPTWVDIRTLTPPVKLTEKKVENLQGEKDARVEKVKSALREVSKQRESHELNYSNDPKKILRIRK